MKQFGIPSLSAKHVNMCEGFEWMQLRDLLFNYFNILLEMTIRASSKTNNNRSIQIYIKINLRFLDNIWTANSINRKTEIQKIEDIFALGGV